MTIPAGPELDAKIALHLFGWRWFQRDSGGLIHKRRCALYPPDDGNWVRWNFHDSFEQIGEWPEPKQRFSDWDRCGSVAEDRSIGRPLKFLPNYSSEWSDMRIVVEKMRELGWLVQMQQQEDGKWEAVFMNEDCEDEIKWADSLPHAVCLASLAAVESQKENSCSTK